MIYRYNAISIQIPMMFFAKVEKLILEFMWSFKESHIAKVIFTTKKIGRLIPTNFKTYGKAAVIKTM